jgi:glycosyltransferase involved in cell wall biosynthesis
MKKIKVQLDFNISKKFHTLYHSFFNNPPEGVEYIKSNFRIINEKNYSALGKIYNKTVSIFPFIKRFHQKITDLLRKDSGADLTHITFHLGHTKKPCVIDYETAYTFINREYKNNKWEKKKVIKKLNKRNVKYLIPIHKEALKSFKLFFGDCVKKPQEIVYPTIFIPKENKKNAKKKKRVIFIGSSNISTDKTFMIKGGYETLLAFENLAKKYKDYEFFVVSNIPKNLEIKKRKNLVIKDILPQKELWKIMSDSSIFIQPNYHTPAMAFLEAMRFKLPIIAYDFWANKEYVEKNNGILIKIENPGHIDENNVPDYTETVSIKIKENALKNAKKIEKEIEKLIKKPSLAKKMGEAGYNKLVKGKFSINERNKKLREIYELTLK